MEMKNREQRRREKFGKAGKVHQHNPLGPWPEIEANPALTNLAPGEATVATDAEPEAAPDSSPKPAASAKKPAQKPAKAPAKATRPAAKAVTNAAKG